MATCQFCNKRCKSQRALSLHYLKFAFCKAMICQLQNQNVQVSYQNTIQDHSIPINQNSDDDNDESIVSNEIQLDYEWDNNSILSSNSGTSIISNTFHYTDDIGHEVNLLKIINDLGAPLYAYELIMKWARDSHLSNYSFDSKHKTYKQTISYLEDQLQFKICRPTNVPVTLLTDNATINVVVFDVKKMLASLFDDPRIN